MKNVNNKTGPEVNYLDAYYPSYSVKRHYDEIEGRKSEGKEVNVYKSNRT